MARKTALAAVLVALCAATLCSSAQPSTETPASVTRDHAGNVYIRTSGNQSVFLNGVDVLGKLSELETLLDGLLGDSDTGAATPTAAPTAVPTSAPDPTSVPSTAPSTAPTTAPTLFNGTHRQGWAWQLGTTQTDVGYAVAVDKASGGIYVAGSTAAAMDSQPHAGGNDIGLWKFWANGTRAWTRLLGSGVNDLAVAVAVDSSGSVYAAGYTQGSLDGNSRVGSSDMFVTKYTSSGDKQWTTVLGSIDYDDAVAVAVDPVSGSVLVTGRTEGFYDFQTGLGARDAFLTKLDSSSGSRTWSRQIGTISNDAAQAVVVDSTGDVIIAGYTEGDLDGITNANSGTKDMFLRKMSPGGFRRWTQLLGGSFTDTATGLAIDSQNNILVVGDTSSSSFGGQANTAAGTCIFVVKFSSNGTRLWTRLLSSGSVDFSAAIAVDSADSVYVTGYTHSSFDGLPVGDSWDIVVAKLSADGIERWRKQLRSNGDGDDKGYGIALDAVNNVYVAGETTGNFAGGTSSYGGRDVALIQLVSQS